MILHVGTNDVKSKEPQQVAGSVVDLARQIENSSDATVIKPELVSRRDRFNEAVKTVNKQLKFYCWQNGWKFIQHQHISEKELNKGGLHLNFKGNQQFFKNFQMSLGWSNALSTDAVPIQCTKRNTEESHEPTSVLPSQRGFKLAS